MNVGGGSGNSVIIWGPTLTVDKWHHFAITCDGTTFKFYVNGVLQGTQTLTGTFAPVTQPTFLGRRGDSSGDGYHMKGEFISGWGWVNLSQTPS